jgi:hypothetical protein
MVNNEQMFGDYLNETWLHHSNATKEAVYLKLKEDNYSGYSV